MHEQRELTNKHSEMHATTLWTQSRSYNGQSHDPPTVSYRGVP